MDKAKNFTIHTINNSLYFNGIYKFIPNKQITPFISVEKLKTGNNIHPGIKVSDDFGEYNTSVQITGKPIENMKGF